MIFSTPSRFAPWLVVLLLAGCQEDAPTADAYGQFEAVEVMVSSEMAGRLVTFTVTEGQRLDAGAVVGLVDTTQLALQRAQLVASRRVVRARARSVLAQIDVLEAQKAVLAVEQARVARLLTDGAATPKQRDDLDGQVRVLDQQMASIRTQNPAILGELDVLDAQVAQVDDRIRRSRIHNPVAGTVLTTYAEAHELTGAGQPLYKIANLDALDLRAYLSGAQLPHVRIGQQVTVLIDADATTNRALSGEVTWIAAQAEFTPRPIQTKEERVTLVYAFTVRVANPDGALKIGMPGEVRFTP